MKKTQPKKLLLSRETLHKLDSKEVELVNGGLPTQGTVTTCCSGCPSH